MVGLYGSVGRITGLTDDEACIGERRNSDRRARLDNRCLIRAVATAAGFAEQAPAGYGGFLAMIDQKDPLILTLELDTVVGIMWWVYARLGHDL